MANDEIMASNSSRQSTGVPRPLPPLSWWEKNQRIVFEMMKIMQICICVFFVTTGVIVISCNAYFYGLFKDWNYWPFWGIHYQFKCTDASPCGFWGNLGYFFWFYSFWMIAVASIFGIVGAAAEQAVCQAIYAIPCTIWLTCFSWMPWMLFVGIIQEWRVPYWKRHPLLQQV